MAYLIDAIERAAKDRGSVTFLTPGGHQRMTWAELYDDASALAAHLHRLGVGPRPLVVLALTSRPAVTAALAGWLTGASVTFAPTPARTMDTAGYLAETGRRIDSLGTPVVLVGSPWTEAIDALSGPGRTVVELDAALDTATAAARGAAGRRWHPPPVAEESAAILQLTSGTTDRPKTVRISHANLAANVEAIKRANGHSQVHGRMFSWLPLSHDMGLVGGLILPMSCGACDTVLSSPVDYLANPGGWMRQIARYRATTTVGPNSAYALAAKLLAAGPALDLSSLRLALVGGEAVDPDAMDAFAAAAARHGADPGVVLPAYGLAEATVAVTLTPQGRGLRCDLVDGDDLEKAGVARPVSGDELQRGRPRRMPLLGSPVDGLEVAVVDPETGAPLPDRRVGEIRIRGTSVTAGYHGDTAATEAAITPEGWLLTGDLGYLADGELVVTGRRKDIIIIGGRNVYPDEVERIAAQVPGVRAGNVVACAVRRPGPLGGEALAVAAESRSERTDEVRQAVLERVRDVLGITPHDVVILPPGSIPKTPSGKLQRSETARRLGW
ncbi:AMP-binding protein [Frankia sp. Cpl3]|nr:AMP-binding protein [Frankia sp. Cpl3]